MTNPHQYLLGTAFVVAAVTASLQLSGRSTIGDYKPDANDKCIETYVWNTTANSGGGPLLCPGWYRERQTLDRKVARASK